MQELLQVVRIHQINFMLSLGSMCFTIFVFLLLTGNSTKKRKALLVLEFASSLLLFSDRAALIYDGNPSTIGFYMARISNFLLFSLNYVVLSSYSGYLRQVIYDIVLTKIMFIAEIQDL